MKHFKVGDTIKSYIGSEEGFFANVLHHDVFFSIVGSNPPQELINTLENGELELRLFQKNGAMWYLLRVGKYGWMDALHIPLVAAELLPEDLSKHTSFSFTISLVSLDDGKVISRVHGHLPGDISSVIATYLIQEKADESLTLESYGWNAEEVLANHPISKMVEKAQHSCILLRV